MDASINRSPSAYLNNPEEERRNYKYDTDKEMTLVKFVDEEWGPIGCFNWFATHGTSMSRTNSLISGDNKGAAARFMEDWYNTDVMGKGFESQSLIKSGAYKVPRRISNIIPDFHEHRKFNPVSCLTYKFKNYMLLCALNVWPCQPEVRGC